MKILVTGGAGFIGSHIVDLALARGHEVAVLDDLSSGKAANLPAHVPIFCCDIRDKNATFAAFQQFRPDAVCHQAAQVSVTRSMLDPALDAAINVVGSLHVAEAAQATGARSFVFASTGGAIYGQVDHGTADENHQCKPISPYAISKLNFEMLLAVYRDRAAFSPHILRYANVYGPRQDPHGEAGVIAVFLRRALENASLQINAMSQLGDDGCIHDYVYVSDVARANLDALEGKLSAAVMNLGTGQATTTRSLAESILRTYSDSQSKLSFAPARVGDIQRSVLNGSRYSLQTAPYTDFSTGMRLTAAWYREAMAELKA